MIIILVLIIIAVVLKLASDAAATSNLKRQQKENWERLQASHAQRKQEISEQYDCYYDKTTNNLNPFFYSDGSVKKDVITGKYYAKGEYRCSADGRDANLNQVGPNVPKPPKG